MHLYKKKHRIGQDRPQGVNIPAGHRRLIRVVSGDTLSFTANVVCPATREPVKAKDLEYTEVWVAVAETRFTPVLWAGSIKDRWIVLDPYRPGLIHITVPRTVMNVLRRGAYSFSIVVDDGVVRETQMTGNFQIEYEPTGSINDIPYRSDQGKADPIYLTPEIDLAAQRHRRLTYDQLVSAVAAISRTLFTAFRLTKPGSGGCGCEPSYDVIEETVHRLAQLIVWDDELRKRISTVIGPPKYDPSYDEFVARVLYLAMQAGVGYPCVPGHDPLPENPAYDEVVSYVRWTSAAGLWDPCTLANPEIRQLPEKPTHDELVAYVGGQDCPDYDGLIEHIRTLAGDSCGR